MKIDTDKLSLVELTNLVFARAKSERIDVRMRFVYPRTAKAAKKKAAPKKKAAKKRAAKKATRVS